MARILVTGGAGFVGSHLVRECLALGWDVSILYQPVLGLELLRDCADRVHLFPVPDETDELVKVFKAVRPDLVFHLASAFLAAHTPADVPRLVQSNVTFGTQVLEAMAQTGVRLFVNTGTSWQHYGSSSYRPVNLYAATKQAFEDILAYYADACSVQAITLKLFDTYGPDDPRPKLFSLLQAAAEKQSALDMSPGEQEIDLVYIDDVVQAFVLAARRLLAGKVQGHEAYAVSSGQPVRLRDLVTVYQKLTGATFPVRWGGRPYREREVMQPWAGGCPVPGWTPKVDIEEGIHRLIEGSYSSK